MYSVTYVGVLVSLLATLTKSLGIEVGSEALTTTVLTFCQLGGAVLALFGRYRAGGVSFFGVKK